MFEKAEGQYQNARELLERGNKLNPNDAAILQVNFHGAYASHPPLCSITA